MAVIIDGTNGITSVNGTAAAPSVTGTDTDTGIVYGTNTLSLATGGTTAVTVDSSQNVGIGTSSPVTGNSKLTVTTGITAQDGTTPALQLYNTGGGSNQKYLRIVSTTAGTLNFEKVDDAYSSATGLLGVTSAGLFQMNSGYGSVATAYGCRAWVNFNGTGTVAIRASGNVSSITDNGTGDYTVNFSSAMPNANYGTNVTASRATNAGYSCGQVNDTTTPTTAAVRVFCYSGSAFDAAYMNVSIFR